MFLMFLLAIELNLEIFAGSDKTLSFYQKTVDQEASPGRCGTLVMLDYHIA